MVRSENVWRIGAVLIVLGLGGCRAEEDAARQGEEPAPAAEAAMTDEPAAGATQPPGVVAPAAGVEQPEMRHRMSIEFARAIEDADLEWLAENGFHVDSVMSETLVVGWLERAEGGPVIDQDPRVTRIHTQMR